MTTLRRPSRRQVLIAGGLSSGLVATGAWRLGTAANVQTGRRAGIAFGTTVTLRGHHQDQATLQAGLDAAWAEIEKVREAANLFSPRSALSRLNRDGFLADAPTALTEMLVAAREVSELTDGAFDITVQPLWRLHESAYKAGRAPSDDDIAAVRALIGYRKAFVDGSRVRLAMPGMALTLNGIAQGYATERCLRALNAHGIADAFLNTGEIGVSGRRNGHEDWTAGIADPRREGAYVALLKPLSGILATSGDYATAFTDDFSAHHIFDPNTLRSPTQMASVSVLTQSGARADALATAMMVMPAAESLALADRVGDVEVLLVSKRGEISRTSGFPVA